MKEKILAAINAKFPGVKLSKKRLDQIVKVIEEDVIDDESKIDAALTNFNKYNSITELAKMDADMRGLNKKVGELESGAKPKDDNKAASGNDKTNDEDDADGNKPPAWAAAMMAPVLKELQTLKAEKALTTTQQKLANDLKDIPEVLWKKRVMPTNDEEYETFVAEVQNDFKEIDKTNTTQAFRNMRNPGGDTQNKQAAGGKDKIDPDVQAYVNARKNSKEAPANAGFSIKGGASVVK